jgi:heme/copper-type cytochrome/quinol oxidase subunit 2
MNWLRSWLLGPQGSVYAGKIDDLYMVIFYLCIFFFLLIFVLTIGSVIVWRKKPGRKTPHITDNLPLELAWSIIPLLLCMACSSGECNVGWKPRWRRTKRSRSR